MIESSGAPPAGPGRRAGWRRLLALQPSMVDFERRGFRTAPASTRGVLEAAARAFLAGYQLELGTSPGSAPDLSGLPAHRRGFAVEGAAMAAVLLDRLNPTRGRRFHTLALAYQDRYEYLLLVGAGWALAKLRCSRLGRLGAGQPLLRWLAYDGAGFCQAFFASPHRIRRWSDHPATACPARCDIRYQGFGRSLWFRDCGDPVALAARIGQLPDRHQGDAWSGVALAASYAGGVEPEAYRQLRELAGQQLPALAQGAAFAAEAWRRCGYVPPHAHAAVAVLVGASVPEAAGWTWAARRGLAGPSAGPADYRCWRLRVQQEAAAATYR